MPAEPYLRNSNEQIVLAAWTNGDGITWEPFIDGRTLGYKLTEVSTGRVEYILLVPTDNHDINPENGATADTFLYHLDQDAADEWHFEVEEHGESDVTAITDFAEPIVYVNHFHGSWQPPSPDDHDNTEL